MKNIAYNLLEFIKKKKKLYVSDIESSYRRLPTLSEKLPWQEYSQENNCFLLNDGASIGLVFEIDTIAISSQSNDECETICKQVQHFLKHCFPLETGDPWVLQFYLEDDDNMQPTINQLENYMNQHSKYNSFSTQQFNLLKKHLNSFSSKKNMPQPLFSGQESFRIKKRRIRMVVYKIVKNLKNFSRTKSIHEINEISEKLKYYFRNLNIPLYQYDKSSFCSWMLNWFNPNHKSHSTNTRFQAGNDEWLTGDIGERLFLKAPRSFANGWYFDEMPHKVLVIDGLTAYPKIGHMTSEKDFTNKSITLFDQFPVGSRFVMTIVIQDQADVKKHLLKVQKSAVGYHAEAKLTKNETSEALFQIQQGNYFYPCSLAVYIKGEDEDQLSRHEQQVASLCHSNGLNMIESSYDLSPADSYFRYLPMCYDFYFDKSYLSRSHYLPINQISRLLPIYGKDKGSLNPGFIWFNRSGEPFFYDPLNAEDKKNNSHLLIIGETGSGKSNLLVYLLSQMLAIYNPRLFILEAGGSFDLFVDYLKDFGKDVNKISLNFESPISLNPFSATLGSKKKKSPSKRDFIGEMLIASQLMITGGDKKEYERFSRSDYLILLKAIQMANQSMIDKKKSEMIASDIVQALDQLSKEWQENSIEKSNRCTEMADSMRYFCSDPLSRQFFDTPGDPWPNADVTLVNMGVFAKEGYEAQRALAFIGCANKVMSLAEANQNNQRPIILICDENHLFTSIPSLSQLLTRIAKMGRKLGLWLWLATQSLADFPDEASKILNMVETWVCLGLSPDEVNQIKRFKKLTEEQQAMLLSSKKVPGQYSEGVLLSSNYQGLFRNIPPKIFLSLAMTEQSEKFQRNQLMRMHDCSEVEAAIMMANDLFERAV